MSWTGNNVRRLPIVRGTPNELIFLNLLQHLVQIELANPLGDCIWQTAEKLVCRATLINDKDDADKLINIHRNCSSSISMSDKTVLQQSSLCTCPCHSNGCPFECGSDSSNLSGVQENVRQKDPPVRSVPPPPPLLLHGDCSAKVPSAPNVSSRSLKNTSSPPRSPEANSRCSSESKEKPLSSGPPGRCVPPPVLPPAPVVEATTFTHNLPQPRVKVKTFAWNKVPSCKVSSSRNNVWRKAASRFRSLSPDFHMLETLFAQPAATTPSEQRHQSLLPSNSSGSWVLQRKLRDSSHVVNLLDPKRSLNISIFLKQCHGTIDNFVELIRNCREEDVGLERLRCLMKILPEAEEIATLNAYRGDIEKLGNPEKFFITLMAIPSFKLRTEGMLLKAEFSPTMEYMVQAAETIIAAADEILNNRSLPGLLYLVLLVGNFLNSGCYNGNAVGFRLTSLWKLVEVRANKPNVTLMNYVVLVRVFFLSFFSVCIAPFSSCIMEILPAYIMFTNFGGG
ncbi:unnamed protein product [Soboliphyme baturini]|uniref:FH2 domain-containing protein n=1 Tax=Soboliphyme baturini TaxID=241478 RepID=A0A183IJH9_9BILA|nr:unnamed protein product [Soboliphyme baturini]